MMTKKTQKFTQLFVRLLIGMVAAMALLLPSCKKKEKPKAEPPRKAFSLSSTSFTDGGQIPPKYGCPCFFSLFNDEKPLYNDEKEEEHLNISPQLSWENAPEGTTSFLIIMEKITNNCINKLNWLNWRVDNIPASKTSLTENDPSIQKNSLKYDGPWGFMGETNIFQITIYALNLPENYFYSPFYGFKCPPKTSTSAEFYLSGHILAKASITGTFAGTYTKK